MMTEKSIVKEFLGDHSPNILSLHEKENNPSIKDILQYIISGNSSKRVTKDKALELYEEYNENHLLNNPIDNNKYEKIIEDNKTFTPEAQQEKYWERLKNIFASIKKKLQKMPCSFFTFWKNFRRL